MKSYTALRSAALAALAAFTLAPMAVQAQEAAPAEQASTPHERLFATMEAGTDQDQVLAISTSAVAAQIIATLPADMTEGQADLQSRLAAALLEPMRVYSRRVSAEFRPRMIAASAEVFTEEEANTLAEFYSSELGRRALAAASSNVSVEATAADGLDDMRVEAESVERDIAATGMRAFGALSTQDRAEIMRISLSQPAFTKMPLFQQRVAPIRAEMESSPPLPAEAILVQQAMARVFAEQ